MPRYRVTISSTDREAMLDLVRAHKIPILDHTHVSAKTGEHRVDAILDAAAIKKLKSSGYHVQQHEDVDETAKARQREVGRGDRYKRRRQ